VPTEGTAYHNPFLADDGRPVISPLRVKEILLLLLLAAHLLWSALTIVPGYLLIDEAVYHWTVKSFADTGSFTVWTGYDEFPSLELVHFFFRIHDGRVVSQYPYLFPLISWPFYKVWGFSGLFVVNALSFVGIVGLCYGAARRLFKDRELAVNACLIMGLATFLWEYSQAAWPHILSILFTLASFYAAVRAHEAPPGRAELLWALLSGLVMGFGPGIRLDASLVGPCILIPFLFRTPAKVKAAAAFILGVIPGLAILAYTNLLKFGVFSPFTYGTSVFGYAQTIPLGLTGAALSVMLLAWFLSREPVIAEMNRRIGRYYLPVLAVSAAGVCLALALWFPSVAAVLKKTMRTFYEAVVDIRFVDPSISLPSMERSQGGGVVYVGSHKKALLQSLPYLTLLFVPLTAMIRRTQDRFRLGALFMIPAAYISFYSYLTYEYGGLCLNYRFLLPILPFTSILCAYAWAKLNEDWRTPASYTALAIAALGTVAAFAGFMHSFLTLESLEFPLLMLPHLMAGLILAFIIAGYLVETEGVSPLRIACMTSVAVAMTWAGLTAFFYDYARHRDVRLQGHLTDRHILARVPPDSLFISSPYLSPALVEGPRIRIAFPGMDKGKDAPKLISFHLDAGRRVFGVFTRPLLEHVLKADIGKYKVKPMVFLPGGFEALAEIVPANGASDDAPPKESSGKDAHGESRQ
jgi:hypothetical protein